jgi:hypothetical protein|tara:strand:+ start:5261 stop:5389 length:129 start_codon:yes stop_codon:yes gene_type:complete
MAFEMWLDKPAQVISVILIFTVLPSCCVAFSVCALLAVDWQH